MSARFAPLTSDDPRAVGGYVLRARLGEGGMGRVFLAFSPGGRALAIKVVRPEYAQDPQFRRRFRREIKAARSVQGLYTAAVVDADSEAPVPWLATAYVPGPTLHSAVAGHGPLPLRTVFRLMAGVAEGLRAIHAGGLVHRDLKPANVILAVDGPRVIDFGIAYAADATTVTGTDVVVGTPAFMAPEQARGDAASAATDVFALGGLMVFAATGRTPFGEGTPGALLYRVVNESADLDRCPPELRAIAERALAKDPRQRPSLGEIMDYASRQIEREPVGLTDSWLPTKIVRSLFDYDATRYGTRLPPPEKTKVDNTEGAKRAALVTVILAASVALVALLGTHGPQNMIDELRRYLRAVSSPTPTVYTSPTPATTSPAPVYTAPTPAYTPPAPIYTAPMPVYTPPAPVYQPPVMHYGAIAVSGVGGTGKSWNYGSAPAAAQHALRACRRSDCRIVVQFVNSCGAVAYNPIYREYWGGQGATEVEAEDNAISNSGGGYWIAWACTTR